MDHNLDCHGHLVNNCLSWQLIIALRPPGRRSTMSAHVHILAQIGFRGLDICTYIHTDLWASGWAGPSSRPN